MKGKLLGRENSTLARMATALKTYFLAAQNEPKERFRGSIPSGYFTF